MAVPQATGARLYRSQTDKRIAGVCGGIAEYFGIDPLIVRVAFVVAAFMQFGILLYVILWIVLPKAPPGYEPSHGYGRPSSAIRIAEERYARGEIQSEELARIRADLGG
jgi:phage shock protein C